MACDYLRSPLDPVAGAVAGAVPLVPALSVLLAAKANTIAISDHGRQKSGDGAALSLRSCAISFLRSRLNAALRYALARLGDEPRSRDPGKRRDFVVVGIVAGNTDGADHLVVRVTDQDS